MRAVSARRRGHLDIGSVRAGFLFGQRERAQLFAGHKFRQPLPFLFVRAEQQQRANADGMVRVHKHRCRCAAAADLLQNSAVRHLGEPVTANFRRRSRTEHADSSQSIDHITRNVRLPIDLRRIEMFIQKFAQLTKRLVDLRLFRCRDPRIRHHPIGNEMALEQAFDKTERLRAGKK